MALPLLLVTVSFAGMCAANPHQDHQERINGSGPADTKNDIFTDILSSNQGSSRFMLQGDIAVRRNRNALVCRGKSCLWPKSGDGLVRVPYTLSNNYTTEEKEVIRAAMEEVTVLTCIRFIPRHAEPDYLRIQPFAGCWSYVGRVGGAQDLSLMKTGCLHWGIIQHELLHALGFQHEQCRSDRDKYIRINWGNINQDKERNFYKMSTQNLGVPYDYLSVLHYGKFAFASDAGKPTLEPTGDPHAMIGQRVGLSSMDVVKINKLFDCNVCSYLLPDAQGTLSWESKQHPNISTCVWLIRVPEGKDTKKNDPEDNGINTETLSIDPATCVILTTECRPKPFSSANVFLQFESFNVQSSPACAEGAVTVYDGMHTKSPTLLQKTCGNGRPHGQVASGNVVRIELASRGIGINFKAIYNSINCGRSLTNRTGNFSSPGFPAKYPNSVNCVWVLSAPAGNKIRLHVAPFSLESSPNCSYDYFLLRDGQRQKKKCGLLPMLDYTATTRSLMVYFHSDSSVQERGFFATYSFAPISERALMKKAIIPS